MAKEETLETNVTFRLDVPLKERLGDVGVRTGVSLGAVVRGFLLDALDAEDHVLDVRVQQRRLSEQLAEMFAFFQDRVEKLDIDYAALAEATVRRQEERDLEKQQADQQEYTRYTKQHAVDKKARLKVVETQQAENIKRRELQEKQTSSKGKADIERK